MPPSLGWQPRFARHGAQQENITKRRRKASREAVKESKAERWRAKYRRAGDSPFNNLPGMASRVESRRAAQPVIPDTERRRAGMASRGAASTLDPQTAQRILSLMAEDWTITAIAKELETPRTTLSRWLSSGRVEKVAAAVGESRHIRTNAKENYTHSVRQDTNTQGGKSGKVD